MKYIVNESIFRKERFSVRIQEIAEKAGVSIATVSRVFSHHPNIRREIRDRVFAVAREYGYHPRLSTKQRNVVIVAPYKLVYPVQAYVEMVMTELTRELSFRGYRIEILPHDNLERLESIQFCGAVSIGVETPLFERWDERFVLPLILVDRQPSGRSGGVLCVRSDELQGMDLAVGHLAECGCRRIGSVIHGRIGMGNVDLRRSGILSALEKRGLPAEESLVRIALPDDYIEEIGKLLRNGIDGLFCCGGSNAGGIAAYALSLYGKRIPEDIQLVSSERAQTSRYCIPPQTTISQDYSAVASAVAAALDSGVRGEEVSPETVIPYRLILRDSTAPR